MQNLSILSKEIRQFDGLYSLNDLHKAAGNEAKHQPNRFIRITQTQELIQEISKYPDMGILPIQQKRGVNGGTYVCKELVYAYAMWISAKFHLTVIRAFDQLTQQPISSPMAEQEKYALLNAMISSINLEGNPVLIPYIDLVNFTQSIRYFQESAQQLQKASNVIDERIQDLKLTTGKELLE